MRLYLSYLSIHVRSQMQYKSSFLLTLLGQFIGSFSAFFSIYFLFQRFNSVEGFSYQEVLLCFAIMMVSFSLAEIFARGFDVFPQMIGNGEFDRIMVRPRNEIFQILASKMEFNRFGKVAQALIIFIYAIPASGIHWTADRVLTLILMILCGTAVFSGLFIIYASICFFTLEGLEVMNIFTDGGREFGKYPFSVYGKGVLKFLTYAIPLALFQYYPLLYLIGQSDNIFHMLCPLFSLFFLVPCYLVWKFGLRHYKSAGS